MMKAAEYVGRVRGDGNLDVPALVRRELSLQSTARVRVILLREEDSEEERRRLAARQADIWRQVDDIRAQLAGMPFSLTDSLLQTRQEEDDTL